MFLSFLRREILFDYEQYEYHGTSVSRQIWIVFLFQFWKPWMNMDTEFDEEVLNLHSYIVRSF